MELFLMRHGQTDLNKQFRLQGSVNEPLNAIGKQQALKAGETIRRHGLAFDKVICSPLIRAIETAEISTGIHRNEFVLDPRVQEMYYGPYDGKKILRLPLKVLLFLAAPNKKETPAGIESVDSLYERTSEFLQDIAREEEDKIILVVTHGIAMRSMLGFIQGQNSRELWENKYSIDNCALFHVPVNNGRYGEFVCIK